jgi:hypothetical protein
MDTDETQIFQNEKWQTTNTRNTRTNFVHPANSVPRLCAFRTSSQIRRREQTGNGFANFHAQNLAALGQSAMVQTNGNNYLAAGFVPED